METENKLPLVSVVIPAYNAAAFLAETIDSVRSQSYKNVEIIVVNDGSTDDTKRILDGYAGQLTAIHQQNGGLASARNRGLQAARGPYIALLDSDDICMPERLAAQVACLQRLPNVVLCCSDFSAYVDGQILEPSHIATYYRQVRTTEGGMHAILPLQTRLEPGSIPEQADPLPAPIDIFYGDAQERLAWGNFIHPPTVMARRDAIDRAGLFDQTIRNGTDYDWLMRISETGQVAYLDQPLLKYRYSEQQLSAPQHSAQLSLDTITALQNLDRRHPSMFDNRRLRFWRRIGACHHEAAYALVETDKVRAVRHLLLGLVHGVIDPNSIKIAIKLLLPRSLLAWRRRRRQSTTLLHGRGRT